MNSGLWKAAAVLSAVTLVAVYVYDQAGGQLLHRWGAADSNDAPRSEAAVSDNPLFGTADRGGATLMPGSKSAAIMPPADVTSDGNTTDANSPALMYSSKSGMVKLPLPMSSAREFNAPGPARQELAQPVFEANSAGTPPSQPTQTADSEFDSTVRRRGPDELQLMPGSKSPGRLFTPPQAAPGK